jgi:hypothetical protein
MKTRRFIKHESNRLSGALNADHIENNLSDAGCPGCASRLRSVHLSESPKPNYRIGATL